MNRRELLFSAALAAGASLVLPSLTQAATASVQTLLATDTSPQAPTAAWAGKCASSPEYHAT